MPFQAFLPTKVVDKEQCVYLFMHKELVELLPCYERAGGMAIPKINCKMVTTGFSLEIQNLMEMTDRQVTILKSIFICMYMIYNYIYYTMNI